MRLHHLHIDGFGKLKNVDLDLAKGFQVLYGTNEKGKSTILQFIRAMFYGVADRKTSDPARSRHRYKPWQGGLWGGTILFSHEDRDYRLTRRFGEAKSQDQIQLSYANSGETLDYPWAAQQQPGEYYFGLTQSAFQAAAFLGQLADERLVLDQDGSVANRLQRLAGSLDETVSAQTLFSRFEKAQKDLSRSHGRAGRLPELQMKRDEYDENEAQYCALEEQADALVQTWEALNETYLDQVSERQRLQAERDEVQALSDRYLVLKEKREVALSLKRFQERSEALENQLLNLHTTPQTVGQDLQTLRQHQNLGREIQQEMQLLQEKKEQCLENKTRCEEKIQNLDFSKENGVYPWEIYQEKQREYAKLENELNQCSSILKARELLYKEDQALTKLQEEGQDLEAKQMALHLDLETKEMALEKSRLHVQQESQLAREHEQNVVAEEVRLLERRRVRNQELERRKAKYNRYLKTLKVLSILSFSLVFVGFGLAYGLFEAGATRQISLLVALAFLTIGSGLAVHRSIFPAAEPTLVTEPDAEGWLNQLRAQKEAQDQILATSLASQQGVELAVQTLHVEQAQLKVRIEENQKNIKAQLAKIKAKQEALVDEEETFQEALKTDQKCTTPLTDEALGVKLATYSKQRSNLLAWREAFLQKRNLADDQALLEWKSNCEMEERQLALFREQEIALDKQVSENLSRQKEALYTWGDKYAHLKESHIFEAGLTSERHEEAGTGASERPEEAGTGASARGEAGAWQAWLYFLQQYEQKLVQTMEGYRHTTAIYKQMMAEQGGKAWAKLEQEQSREYSQYLQQLQSLPTLHQLWESYDDKKQFFKDQQVSYSRKLEASYMRESELRENMQELTVQRRQILQDVPTDQERSQEKASLNEELRRQQAYLKALQQGEKWLKKASDDLSNTIAPVLNERVGAYLSELSLGSHQEVFVAKDMAMHLTEASSSQLQRETLFSAGTQEQIYLALRLSLAELLTGERQDKSLQSSLPLFCDDPFVNYDQERMAVAYRLLAKLGAEGRQILLTTCHPAPVGFDPNEEAVVWTELGDENERSAVN